MSLEFSILVDSVVNRDSDTPRPRVVEEGLRGIRITESHEPVTGHIVLWCVLHRRTCGSNADNLFDHGESRGWGQRDYGSASSRGVPHSGWLTILRSGPRNQHRRGALECPFSRAVRNRFRGFHSRLAHDIPTRTSFCSWENLGLGTSCEFPSHQVTDACESRNLRPFRPGRRRHLFRAAPKLASRHCYDCTMKNYTVLHRR